MQLVQTPLRTRRRAHLILAALPAAALGLTALHVARVASGTAGSWSGTDLDGRISAAAIVLCGLAVLGRSAADRADRAAWMALGIGLAGYGTVTIVAAPRLGHGMASVTPSAAALWLAFYPFVIACVVLLARSRADRFDAGLVVDGLIGGVTLAAVAAEVGLRPLLDHTHQPLAGIAVDGIWIASDLALLGVMAGCAALATSRGQRERWLLFAGGLVLAAGDALSLYHGTAAMVGLPGGPRQTLVPRGRRAAGDGRDRALGRSAAHARPARGRVHRRVRPHRGRPPGAQPDRCREPCRDGALGARPARRHDPGLAELPPPARERAAAGRAGGRRGAAAAWS